MRSNEKLVLRRTAWRSLKVCAGVLFGVFAIMKLLNFAPMVRVYKAADLPPLLRYLVGFVELAGAVLVLTRRSSLVGALLLLAVALFIAVHVVLLDANPLPVIFVLALPAAIVVGELSGRGRGRGREQAGRSGGGPRPPKAPIEF